jgi:YVTN family beta-propeller protein
VTIDARGERAYTVNVESNDVSVTDLAAGTLLGTVAVGKRPYAVALPRRRGFSTDQYGGTVSVFDLATLQLVKRISIGDYPEESKPAPTATVFTWSIGSRTKSGRSMPRRSR